MATIRGTAGDDFQIGTDANDRIVASPGRDVLDGRGGFDSLDYRNVPAGIVQLHGDFVLPGGEIFGNILVFDGFGFDDLVIGNLEGVLGSRFDDAISGDDNDNRLFGFAGDDRIRGGEGDNFVDGGEGDDTVTGGRGDDHLVGRGGDDVLTGNDDPLAVGDFTRLPEDQDTLIGLSGDDTIIDSADLGFSEMRGGSGHDTMQFGGIDSAVRVFGEQGNDTAVISNFDGGGQVDGGSGDDVLRFFGSTSGGGPEITGGPGDDTIEVIAEEPTVRGGAGDDTISGIGDPAAVFGDDGDDVLSFEGTAGLFGGRGDDLLINADSGSFVDGRGVVHDGGSGNDVLRGGEEADEFVLTDRGADIIENFVSGEDIISIEDTGLSFGDFDTNENTQLDAGDDVVTVSAGDLSIDIAAAAGFNFLETVTVVDTPTLDEIDVMFS
jgi:Ca2+-binding RTX toxin-like protein